MTLIQVWGALLIFTVCPILGGMPLAGITRALTGKTSGILAILSEAGKGIAAVLLARVFFPEGSIWEIVALIALVAGRYAFSRETSTTNVVWGVIIHDWRVAVLVLLIGGVSFTIVRERQLGHLVILILYCVITALLYPHDSARLLAASALSLLLGLIYRTISHELDLPSASAQEDSRKVFYFFRGERAIISLDEQLDARKVGQKAATLSKLKRRGYPVPAGWVLPAGDDPQPLIDFLEPSVSSPLVVRLSVTGKDSFCASAAGIYESILNITNREELASAIACCFASYDSLQAQAYRRDFRSDDDEDCISVLIQQQIRGVFSGVAFSRDPIDRQGNAVVIEALPGDAKRVVSGYVTPEQYRVYISEADISDISNWQMPADRHLQIEGEEGDLPPALIQQVAYLARHIEMREGGIPQNIEWSYDGQNLWLLQAQPVTTLLPIWTRKIAAEVIPGLICPLSWSINRTLASSVWGEIFTLVLGKGAACFDFNKIATLHYSRVYFNASLLAEIFQRMGLPPESLEFLTPRGKFTKPPLLSTLKQLPGLLRLLQREWRLEEDFERDYRRYFAPALNDKAWVLESTNPVALIAGIDLILEVLKRATYYRILAPLSFFMRKEILKVSEAELDNSKQPEVAARRALQELAVATRHLLSNVAQMTPETAALFARLAEIPDGQIVLQQLEDIINRYGYLSEVANDIDMPRWQENPQAAREIFAQFLFFPPQPYPTIIKKLTRKAKIVQSRLNLKGRVNEIYSKLLAKLRYSFVAVEKKLLQAGWLGQKGDIFYLKFEEIRSLVAGDERLRSRINKLIEKRRSQLEEDKKLTQVPQIIYGNAPAKINRFTKEQEGARQKLQGIGASPGQVEGQVKVLRNWQVIPNIERDTILVVPYTDSGWIPVLARAGGLITEVGGRLSHGAIIAREYGIPAVMNIHNATHLLRDGQRVRIDGQQGIIEIL
ncbi:MAG: PEP-utilizing enzyme [Oscillatoriaceae bacterium SKW80]|nr:PEP-utilizing enzyme [Oscillatoriaceae bacterium SKYG93]MCX8119995.1 PEP-utilizing enzyme [Oscillatoriaceae bacterium SKW80]MDW8454156.1 PEP/pyruvate-binding domain-containing protein [Oscillatoriaceae cyanobacterium SKYGB_i_bin93]HIK27950.1 pyruvate phosphate dikinase PEP/pyruvate-binding protein [Oscillatoriaceae cyanobacterium M7585_C2015_266]